MVGTCPVYDPLREELRMRLSVSHKESWSRCGEAAQELIYRFITTASIIIITT